MLISVWSEVREHSHPLRKIPQAKLSPSSLTGSFTHEAALFAFLGCFWTYNECVDETTLSTFSLRKPDFHVVPCRLSLLFTGSPESLTMAGELRGQRSTPRCGRQASGLVCGEGKLSEAGAEPGFLFVCGCSLGLLRTEEES